MFPTTLRACQLREASNCPNFQISKFPKFQIKAREYSGIGDYVCLEVRPEQNDCEIVSEEKLRHQPRLPAGSSQVAVLTNSEMLKLSGIRRIPKRSHRDAGCVAPAEEQPCPYEKNLPAFAKRWMLSAVDTSWFGERFSPPESRLEFLSCLAYRRDWSEI